MESLNLNLPDALQQFVNGQAEAGRFEGPAAYIQNLFQRAKNGKEKLEALLIDGLDSGEPLCLDSEEWSRIRDEVRQRLQYE